MKGTRVQTEEITIRISDRRKMHYLCEAIASYEVRHIENNQGIYLPELLLDLQDACQLEYSNELTEACMKQIEK